MTYRHLVLLVSYHYKNQMYKLNSNKTAKPIKFKMPLVPHKRLCHFAKTKLLSI